MPEPQATRSERCIQVPDRFLRGIEEGITTDDKLSDGWSIRSKDFKAVWYVSARVSPDEVATWATTRNPAKRDPGLLLAVSDWARENSTWGVDVDESSPIGQIKTIGWDGGFESQECLL